MISEDALRGHQTHIHTCNPMYRHVIIRKDILQERQTHHMD
jgi:hypothetical protein